MRQDCGKCSGKGRIFSVSHVKGGVCFACNGTGERHTVRRTKVYADKWTVSCEGTTYRPFDNQADANTFADDVAAMHLEPVQVEKSQTYTIVTTKEKHQ